LIDQLTVMFVCRLSGRQSGSVLRVRTATTDEAFGQSFTTSSHSAWAGTSGEHTFLSSPRLYLCAFSPPPNDDSRLSLCLSCNN